MKLPAFFAALTTLTLLTGCGQSSTKVTVRVIEHKPEAGGKYYSLLCEVKGPKGFAGFYDVAATQKTDLVAGVDGGLYAVELSPSMLAALNRTKPHEYHAQPPATGSDFFDTATPVK